MWGRGDSAHCRLFGSNHGCLVPAPIGFGPEAWMVLFCLLQSPSSWLVPTLQWSCFVLLWNSMDTHRSRNRLLSDIWRCNVQANHIRSTFPFLDLLSSFWFFFFSSLIRTSLMSTPRHQVCYHTPGFRPLASATACSICEAVNCLDYLGRWVPNDLKIGPPPSSRITNLTLTFVRVCFSIDFG